MKIDNDLIAPFIVGVATIVFIIGQMYLMPISSAEQVMDENQALFSELSASNRELNIVYKELEGYKATQEIIESLGASPEQAKDIIMASEALNLDPKN